MNVRVWWNIMLLRFYTANSNVEVVLHTSEGGGEGGGVQ